MCVGDRYFPLLFCGEYDTIVEIGEYDTIVEIFVHFAICESSEKYRSFLTFLRKNLEITEVSVDASTSTPNTAFCI